MPIITKPGSIQKNVSASITLNKSVLAVNSIVAADTYFSDSTNWNQVIINYKSPIGNQKESLIFDASLASPTASFLVSLKARDTFEVQDIIITDFDGGFLKVERANLTTTDFDISFGGGGGGGTAYQYYKLRITSAFSEAGNLNSNQYTYAVLNEVKFKVNGINTTPVSAQAYGSWSNTADLLIDGNLGTEIYQSGLNSLVDNIVFNMGSSVSASDILICPRSNIGSAIDNYVPRNISVLGSNDNSNFTLIKEVDISNNPGDWAASTFRTISLT